MLRTRTLQIFCLYVTTATEELYYYVSTYYIDNNDKITRQSDLDAGGGAETSFQLTLANDIVITWYLGQGTSRSCIRSFVKKDRRS